MLRLIGQCLRPSMWFTLTGRIHLILRSQKTLLEAKVHLGPQRLRRYPQFARVDVCGFILRSLYVILRSFPGFCHILESTSIVCHIRKHPRLPPRVLFVARPFRCNSGFFLIRSLLFSHTHARKTHTGAVDNSRLLLYFRKH